MNVIERFGELKRSMNVIERFGEMDRSMNVIERFLGIRTLNECY